MSGELNYKNNIKIVPLEPIKTGRNCTSINVAGRISLFQNKVNHTENLQLTKADSIGYTIIWGNDGELPWRQNPSNKIAAVEDILSIDKYINLKLMSLSMPCEYELYIVAKDGCLLPNAIKLKEGDLLKSGVYTLQVRKCVGGTLTPYFDIPCQTIESFSMLFQILFNCSSEEHHCGC